VTFTRPLCFPLLRTNRFAIILGQKTIRDKIKLIQCRATLAPRKVTKLSGSREICCCLLAGAGVQVCLSVCMRVNYVCAWVDGAIMTHKDVVNDQGENKDGNEGLNWKQSGNKVREIQQELPQAGYSCPAFQMFTLCYALYVRQVLLGSSICLYFLRNIYKCYRVFSQSF